MSMTHYEYDKHQKHMSQKLNEMGISTTFKPPDQRYALHKTNTHTSPLRREKTRTTSNLRAMHALQNHSTQ